MSQVMLILSALISISTITAVMLVIAWQEFGRPRHALAWAVMFAMVACLWTIDLASDMGWIGPRAAMAAMPTIAGFAAALNTIGFRRRAGLPPRRGALLGAGAVHALVVLALAGRGNSDVPWIIALTLFNALMLALAARTLTGRRKGERAAERVAESGLIMLSLLNFLVFGVLVGMTVGLVTIDLARLTGVVMLFLPGIVAGIGLFVIILLTADLADQTRRLAATDMLTGLMNRRGFDEAARALIASTKRSGRAIALVLIDVDRFKEVNDRFGHPAGDRVLRAVCHRIAQGIGRRDIFSRVGGEEFALFLTDVDVQAAACAVEVLRLHLEAMPTDLPAPHRITASFGLAVPAEPGEELATLFLRADRALYRSKEEGRNRVTIAS